MIRARSGRREDGCAKLYLDCAEEVFSLIENDEGSIF